jgi:predicted RNA-binding Zn ribbon-like protein
MSRSGIVARVTSRNARRAFDFNGNHPAVDFINTVNARPVFTRDDLATADDVFEWAAAAGLPTKAGAVNPEPDKRGFEAIIELRENLYRVLGPLAAGAEPDADALRFVSCRAASAIASAEWVRVGSALEPSWHESSLDAIGDRLADEAMSLLRGPAIARLGACAGCGWLFVDTSRAHARRWCSMNACGVRDKMRRYHRRQIGGVRQA